jgi:enoyl-CoA hydratase
MSSIAKETSFSVRRAGRVAELILDHPPVNAFNPDVWRELVEGLDELATDDELSVLVLRGQGKGFSAGADLKYSGLVGPADTRIKNRIEAGVHEALYEFPGVTICAIHGFCIGAGITVASLCDIRIASADATFSMPEIRWSLSVAGGGAKLARIGMSTGRVREMLFTGRKFTAAEAYDMGLVDHVVEEGGLDGRLAELQAELVNKEPRAVKLMKAGINAAERAGDWERGASASADFTRQMKAGGAARERTAEFFRGEQTIAAPPTEGNAG